VATEYARGDGFKTRIDEQGLEALGPEVYFAPGYSMILTDKGPIWYSKFANEVVGPFADAEE
jgi:hypothetical protein